MKILEVDGETLDDTFHNTRLELEDDVRSKEIMLCAASLSGAADAVLELAIARARLEAWSAAEALVFRRLREKR